VSVRLPCGSDFCVGKRYSREQDDSYNLEERKAERKDVVRVERSVIGTHILFLSCVVT
jgi:hypothetical protein